MTSAGYAGPVKPSIGRVVHYVSYGTPLGEYAKECRAALVTAVGTDGAVELCVLNPTGIFFRDDVRQEELENKIEPGPSGRTGGTWHWPERVDD